MSLNYIGSKRSLLPFLDSHIEVDEDMIFGDLFCGTGIVSEFFSSRCHIIANDICHFSSIVTQSRVIPFDQKIFDLNLDHLNSEIFDGFITKEYAVKRKYFTVDNAKKIDGALQYLKKTDIPTREKDALTASVIFGSDLVANTASVYGSFLKKIKKSASKDIIFPRLTTTKDDSHQVFNLDIFDLIDRVEGFDVVYLDPPYNTRGYGSNYHLLETIAIGDEFVPRGVTGLRPDTGLKNSTFVKKTTVRSSFKKLFDELAPKTSTIFLSYNSDGLLSLSDLKDMVKDYTVSVESQEYRKFASHRGKSSVTEYLIKITT